MLEDAEEVQAISEELQMQQTAGWERRKNWLALLLAEKGAPLMRGEITDDRRRCQQEGWCQALDFVLKRDAQILEFWRELQESQSKESEELEGGDHGVFYEASQ